MNTHIRETLTVKGIIKNDISINNFKQFLDLVNLLYNRTSYISEVLSYSFSLHRVPGDLGEGENKLSFYCLF